MSKNIKAPFMAALAMASAPLTAAAQDNDNNTRVTLSVPVVVDHFSGSSRGWNEGIGENPGLIIEVDRPVIHLSDTAHLRLGATLGAYENSVWRTSVLAGITVEVEQEITDRISLHGGTPIGVVSGYNDGVKPAIAPYIGVSAAISDTTRIGLRAQWLPNKTAPELLGIKPGSTDAVVGLITLSRNF